MSDETKHLLKALALMSLQYLTVGDELDTLFMSAGEHALETLAAHGLVTFTRGDRCGRWTPEGERFLMTA
jgi:hypothetical protein